MASSSKAITTINGKECNAGFMAAEIFAEQTSGLDHAMNNYHFDSAHRHTAKEIGAQTGLPGLLTRL